METKSAEYSEYLNNKYLPGRSLFLKFIYYPKILNEFKPGKPILDLGCGTGEFLLFCEKKHRVAKGIDSNQNFVFACKNKGLSAKIDNVCQLTTIPDSSVENALIDNVLEHLNKTEINLFFDVFEKKISSNGVLVCIVPGERGFKKDPTHKTYINRNLLEGILEDKKFEISKQYNHPLPFNLANSLFYLNMQIFIIISNS